MVRGLYAKGIQQIAEHFGRILYADKAIVVINKPSGLICQSNKNLPLSRNAFDGLLIDVQRKLSLPQKPLQIHRLDKLTTGALLLATNNTHARAFAKQFQDHAVQKTYLAIVRGGRKSFPDSGKGLIDDRLDISDGRVSVSTQGEMAMTEWELLGSSEKVPLSLLRLQLLTGVKHQLRVHLAQSLQCPVLGDTLYSQKPPIKEILDLLSSKENTIPQNKPDPTPSNKGEERLFLHAAHISLTRYQVVHSHVRRQVRLGITAPIPADFLAVCEASGLRSVLPDTYVTGGLDINGESMPMDEELRGFGSRWLG